MKELSSLFVNLYKNEVYYYEYGHLIDYSVCSNMLYCHTGLVLINAIATQDCTHDPTCRHSSPGFFIRGDLMLKTRDLIYSST